MLKSLVQFDGKVTFWESECRLESQRDFVWRENTEAHLNGNGGVGKLLELGLILGRNNLLVL